MKAVNRYIIVDKIKEKPKTVAGLELTEKLNSDNRYLKGRVISVGDQVNGIIEGDIVYYDKHAGHGIQWKDKLYYVIRVEDIVIVE
jgi:co-chaperonin GroES (HSP10)